MKRYRYGAFFLFLGLFCCCFSPLTARAASDVELLYHLLDEQRQRGSLCDNSLHAPKPMPDLAPVAALEQRARQKATASGGAPVMTVNGATADAALRELERQFCARLMNSEMRYVGAAKQGSTWTVILASTPTGEEASSGHSLAGAGGQARPGEEQGDRPLVVHAPMEGGYVPPVMPVAPPEAPRPGITPLHDPAPAQGAPLVYLAPGQSAQGYEGSGTTALASPYGGAAVAGSAAAGVGVTGQRGLAAGSTASHGGAAPSYLMDASGKRVPVIIEGGGAPTVASGGMLIDKNRAQGFTGEAPSDLLHGQPGRSGQPGQARVVDPLDNLEQQYAIADSALGGGGAGRSTGQGKAVPLQLVGEAQTLLTALNAIRQEGRMCGTDFYRSPALVAQRELMHVAQQQAEEMSRWGYFSSTNRAGEGVGERLSSAGYGWAKASENIAVMEPPAGLVLQHWLQQPAQCVTLLSSDYQEIGIGFVPGKNLWVVTLASPQEPEEE